MNYKDYFGPYALEQNNFLKKHFKEKLKQDKKLAPSVVPAAWEELERFSQGGKRLRGGLVRLGYETFGGRRFKQLLPISAAMEITHASLLIHDDIIDQDSTRHNQPTVHKSYEKFHKKTYKKGDSEHYGTSMATCAGIIGCYEGMRLVANADFQPERKITALEFMTRFLLNTGYGELLDIDLAYRADYAEKDVLAISTHKTAWYSIVGPLGLGALLTGANMNKIYAFENYGLPLGTAYQIKDDILGMFGDEKKTNKSASSDIKEGKNTLLYLHALKKGSPKQVQRLKVLWGKKDITKEEIKEVRQIIIDSGSLTYCQKRTQKLVEEAKLAVPKLTRDKKLREVYLTLADYVIERES